MIKKSQKLFLTLCVLIFVISGCGCSDPAPSPSIHDNYTVIEFSFDELLELPSYAQKVLDGEMSYAGGWFDYYENIAALFEENIGADVNEYLTQQIFKEHVVFVCARYGYDKTNYRYSNFTVFGTQISMDRTVLDPNSNAEKDYWLDLIIVPKDAANGQRYAPGILYLGNIFDDEIMGE